MLLPGTAMFEACAAAGKILADALPSSLPILQGFSIGQPLMMPAHDPWLLEAAVNLADGSVQLLSLGSAHSHSSQHCSGQFGYLLQQAGEDDVPLVSTGRRLAQLTCVGSPAGAAPTSVQRAAMAGVWLPHAAQENGYCLQPATADATLHLSGAFSGKGAPLQVPIGMAALAINTSMGNHSCWVHPTAVPVPSLWNSPGSSSLNFRLDGQQRLPFMQLDSLAVKAVATAPANVATASAIPASSQQRAADLLYVTDWQTEQPAEMPSSSQQAYSWRLASSGSSTAATVLASAACSPAAVVAAASNGLGLLQRLLVRQSNAPISLHIAAAPSPLASAAGWQAPMAAAAAASLAALAKAASREFASVSLSSCSQDALARGGAADLAAPADTLGTSATQGAMLRARLLRQPVLAAPPNSHLLPMPRGSLADLRLVQHEQTTPGPGEVKASAVVLSETAV